MPSIVRPMPSEAEGQWIVLWSGKIMKKLVHPSMQAHVPTEIFQQAEQTSCVLRILCLVSI